jgi:uncharacterized membrane protein
MNMRVLPLISAVLCLSLAGARAETVEVTGVDSNDVLNLRAEPRANAPLVGALAPASVGIEVLKRGDGWAFVRAGKLEGWAAARYLRRASRYEGGPPVPLQCLGTEPFWSLTLDGKRAIYQTPDLKPVTADSGPFEQSRNSTIVWRVRPAGGPVASATIEARQACSDDMSDRVYSFSVRVEMRDGMLLSGCCDIRQ